MDPSPIHLKIAIDVRGVSSRGKLNVFLFNHWGKTPFIALTALEGSFTLSNENAGDQKSALSPAVAQLSGNYAPVEAEEHGGADHMQDKTASTFSLPNVPSSVLHLSNTTSKDEYRHRFLPSDDRPT